MSVRRVGDIGATPPAKLPNESLWGGLALEALGAAAGAADALEAHAAERLADASAIADDVGYEVGPDDARRIRREASDYDIASELATIQTRNAQAIVCALQDVAHELRALRRPAPLDGGAAQEGPPA